MSRALVLSTITAVALACLAPACGADDPIPEQLEAFAVSAQSGVGAGSSWTELDASGGATVTGEGRDFHVEVGAGQLTLDLHLPGMSDLSVLDGREVTVTVRRDEQSWQGGSTVTIEDAQGLVFVASSVPGASARIAWGTVVAEQELEGVVWAYTSVSVLNDAGTAEPMPGEVVSTVMDGASWRVVPHAAYRVEDSSGQENDCILAPDVLSFEMLRTDEPAASGRVDRPVELPMLQALGCG